ncbi:MAG: hypothetical protein M5R38_07955 [Candidatus Methylomirabilis sp.]|nr:hypothetical protein [Candidatus Methylomirabilis sp.]
MKNLVTDMDRRSEETIADLVRQALPHHNVLCEEGPDSRAIPDIGGTSTRWTGRPITPTVTPVTQYRSGWNKTES